MQVSLKSENNNEYFNTKTDTHFGSYLAKVFLEW